MNERYKVVVVDDEPNIVEVLCEILTDEGLTAVGCEDGTKALACINQEQPNLVVLDVQMPGMDGIQIFELMRANPQTAATPVIFFTANSRIVHQRLPTYKAQHAVVLPKPSNIDAFIEQVQRLLLH